MKSRKKIKSKNLKYIVLPIVFILAVLYYTFGSFNGIKSSEGSYSSIPESRLPRIYVETDNEKINQLRAYKGDNVDGVANETLTIIPEDRNLVVDIYELSNIQDISYEVRDKYTDSLVERTQLDSVDKMNGYHRAILRIQNLIGREQEYTLKIRIDTSDQPLFFYTTIIWLNSNKINATLQLARDFIEKSFNEKKGRVLINYMESNANADKNQLNEITLASDYSQITWGNENESSTSEATPQSLGMKLASDIEFTLLEAKNYSYVINAEYITSTINGDGKEQLYFNTNEYVFRTIDNKVLTMKFNRKTEEYFDINKFELSGKRLYLGITNTNQLGIERSKNNQFYVFIKQKELFIYDNVNREISKIFSYRGNGDNTFKNIYNKYNVKILKVTDDGNVTFMIYGYNPRGRNEGHTGVTVYCYDNKENKLTEEIFIPVYTFFEDLKFDLEKLSYLNDNKMLTIYISGTIYTVDLDNKDMILVVNNISNESIKVSHSQKYVSWEQIEPEYNNTLVVRNNDENSTQVITVDEGSFLVNCGFMDEDACYGIGKQGDVWREGDRKIADMIHTLKFFDTKTGETRTYVDESFYFQFFKAYDNRIKYKKFIKLNEKDMNKYQYVKDDIIIYTQAIENKNVDILKAEMHKTKKRIYYINITAADKNTIKIKTTPAFIINTAELASMKEKIKTNYFYAYNNGHLIEKNLFIFESIKEIKNEFGYVRYKGRTIWNRANKPAYAFLRVPIDIESDYSKNIPELKNRIVESEDFIIIDAILLIPNELEYFVAQQIPVTVYLLDGTYFNITSYNGKVYKVYFPQSGQRGEYTYQDMDIMFEENGYNAICALRKSRY